MHQLEENFSQVQLIQEARTQMYSEIRTYSSLREQVDHLTNVVHEKSRLLEKLANRCQSKSLRNDELEEELRERGRQLAEQRRQNDLLGLQLRQTERELFELTLSYNMLQQKFCDLQEMCDIEEEDDSYLEELQGNIDCKEKQEASKPGKSKHKQWKCFKKKKGYLKED